MVEEKKTGVMAKCAAMEEMIRRINSNARKMYEEGMRQHQTRVKKFSAAMAEHKRKFWHG